VADALGRALETEAYLVSDESHNRSRWELTVDLLDAYSLWVGLGGFVLAIGMIAVLATRGVPSVPRYWRVFLVAAVACAALGYPAVVKVLRYLYDPPKRYLVQPGVTDDEGGIWELSPKAFENLHVKGGELYEWPGTEYPTYGVEWFDPDSNVCKATWRGTASDGELLQEQEKINEVRDHLEDKAKKHDILVTRAETIVREAVLDNARLLVKEYNRASLIDVSALSERIDETLSKVDLTEDINRERRRRTDPERATDPEAVNQPTQSPETAADGGEVSDG